ncbi:ATP-binding protein [Vibrio splendidus]|uniref:AAA family ATPase n=1 Tax=Vibrio splendidus TaxID=29497 RepID=UPI00148CB7CB|nr:ATP-binding protein [Vibrio splendidus]NOJ04565.1 ATP-binding protein [Vibrio splendidus]
MLIRLTVENYTSICTPQTLNLEAMPYKEKSESNLISWTNEHDNLNLLRTVAIYGPNSGGKSNFISALDSMCKIVNKSATNEVDDELPYKPFKLSTESLNKPTEFEVEFIVDNVKYLYGFSYNSTRILSEWLFAYPKKKAQKWFLRAWDGEEYQWETGRNLAGEKQTWINSTRQNSLFLSTAVQLNSSQLKPIYSWFKQRVAIAGVEGWSREFSARECDDTQRKEKILDLLRSVDIVLDDIAVEKEEFDPSSLPEQLSNEFKAKIAEKLKNETMYKPVFQRKNNKGSLVDFDLSEESDGTNRFFAFAGPWLDALEAGRVLVVDELNSNLHPLLVKHLVSLFHCSKSNPNNAQLIFTTHETSILNQDIFRRDQVWFMQKNKELMSELYSLSDFSPRKGFDNLEDRYLSGSYGALPFVYWEDCKDGVR